MPDEILLTVNNLKTFFHTEEGTIKAVNDVSFYLNRGETIGIVGESGSGKSVSALSIMQLIPSPPGRIGGGEIIFHAKDQKPVNLLSLKEDALRKYRGNEIAMIFQEPMTSLNPVFRCGDQVLEAILLHRKVNKKEGKKIILDLFEKVRLPDVERIYSSYPHQLSGGQKQRVMIAMALSCNPAILIADEPTTALDVTVQKAILELMIELKKELDTSVIFITHDLGVIAEIADRVIVMYKGKIVEQGSVHQIFTNPQHPYTKGLLACRPPLVHRLEKLPVIEDFMQTNILENGEAEFIEKSGSISAILNERIISPQKTAENLANLKSQNPLLTVENLKVWFPKKKGFLKRTTEYVKAVNDVSFEVFPGETLGLVGESGCGKTTLGRAILKLITPNHGKVIFDGNDILSMSDKSFKALRREMQIVFQDPYSSLNPRMTIGNAILEPIVVHKLFGNQKARKERVFELLETVSLHPDHYNRYPHEFSGGQRQRVCIARALALNPRFIICDECVSALDVSIQAQVLNLLIDLRKQFNLTYIFISHDLSVVKFMSDRMMVMNDGKIEEIGPADDIYNNPSKEYTRHLIRAIPKGNLDAIR